MGAAIRFVDFSKIVNLKNNFSPLSNSISFHNINYVDNQGKHLTNKNLI
jgi:hypothetical protein